MPLYLYIATSLVCFVVFNILSRVSLAKTRYEYAYTILWQFGSGVMAYFFLPFDDLHVMITPYILALLLLSIPLWAISDRFLFESYKYEEASVVASVFPFYNIIAVLVSVILFRSILTGAVLFGFVNIIFATLLIALSNNAHKFSKGVIYALLYCVCTGLSISITAVLVQYMSVSIYVIISSVFPALLSLMFFYRSTLRQLLYELKKQWLNIFVSAAVNNMAYFFFFKALTIGNTSEVVILESTAAVLTVFISIFVLDERKHILTKLLAVGIATAGVLLITLSP